MRSHPSPWYREGRFRNLDGLDVPGDMGPGAVLKWKLSRRAPAEDPLARDVPALPIAPDAAALAAPPLFQITWLGHATLLWQLDGVNLVTDPTFGRIGHGTTPRLAPPPLAPDALPRLDALLVTHNHYDHCDLPSLRALRGRNPEATLVVPEGLGPWARRNIGGPVTELPWYETLAVGPVRVTSLPAQHWSIRGPLDRHQSHWVGYHVSGPSGSTLFSGDTGFGPHFAHIAERVPAVDVACLPVGAYAPRWFMQRQHMGPQEAVEAARILGARVLLPVHWGTYRLTDEPLNEPPRLTLAAAAEVGLDVCPLHPGGRYTRAGRHGLWLPPDGISARPGPASSR